MGFLEREDETWACFLVTFAEGSRWHGYISFRRGDGELEEDEVRTADIFLEGSEAEIDHKARGLGRPLLAGLLASALHASERSKNGTPRLRRWFRDMLAETSHSAERTADGSGPPAREDVEALRSLYASYRLDQVAHFIALVRPEDFEAAVDRILAGRPFDFGAKDRLQFAMMVVEHIESLLPLPTFEVWLDDYLANPRTYQLYAHTLHREGRLP
ncbi:MAG TPA: hypothetical protein VGB42_05465 [Candidatus Thermoplasmatota archaeon]